MIRRSALVLALVVACCGPFVSMRPAFAQPAGAASSGSAYLEERVTALPAPALLTRDPAQLVDPRRQEVAKERGFMRRVLFLLGLLLPALALVYLWGSGRSAMLRDAVMRRIPNRIAARFVFGAAIATVAALAVLPSALWSYRLAVAYEMTPQPTVLWLRDALVLWAIAALSIGLLTAFVYSLVERTRLWYVYAAVGLFAFTLAGSVLEPVVVAPVFGAVRPVGAALSASLDQLETRAHVDAVTFLVDDAPRRAIATGRIEGIGPTERIVFSNTLIAAGTPGEIAFVAARELGHRERGDVLAARTGVDDLAGTLPGRRRRRRRSHPVPPRRRLALATAARGRAQRRRRVRNPTRVQRLFAHGPGGRRPVRARPDRRSRLCRSRTRPRRRREPVAAVPHPLYAPVLVEPSLDRLADRAGPRPARSMPVGAAQDLTKRLR